jgi:hypothetical protein
MQTVHAYYDGQSIQLIEPLQLRQNDKLLVTRIENEEFTTSADIEVASLHDIGEDFLTKQEIEYYLSIK